MVDAITLPDGRSLAFAGYGKPDGKPVFFFHGMPGSRFFRPYDEITARVGVRLICMDRPGYGGSTFQPGRPILEWPVDIARLADSLGIDKFSVAGHSGGGPYAAACAWALPDRVRAAGFLCSAAPLEAPGATHGMTAVNRFGFTVGRHLPWPLWQALVWTIYRKRCKDPAATMDGEDGKRPRADDDQIHLPRVRQACLESEKEAFRQGLRGMAWEARLLVRPWGFDLDEIRVPVQIWHGSTDNTTTPAMARYLADKIPNSRLRLCEGEAHLLLFPHWEEILLGLISE